MTMLVDDAVRNAWLQAYVDAFDAGPGPGTIELYDGVQPAKNGTATNLVGTLVLSDPSSASIVAGVLTLDSIADETSATAAGDITWFRMKDSTGAFVLDANAGATGSGATLELNNVTAQLGDNIAITSFVITAPNA